MSSDFKHIFEQNCSRKPIFLSNRMLFDMFGEGQDAPLTAWRISGPSVININELALIFQGHNMKFYN